MNNPSHAGEHDLENDAIVAIENTVGFTGAFNFLPITGGTMSGAVAMGANKITGLANGSASSDAAAYGQLPSVAGLAPIASPTFTGTTTAPEFSASGLTGATAASRYCGSTASGHPTSGTFAVGDFIVDQTGSLWVCTVAGTPGTWAQTGTAGGITALTGDVTASGSGSVAATLVATTAVETIISANSTVAGALQKSGGTMSGAIAMGTSKITGLGNGSGAQDAAAFGQIPTALPPNGSAGGDLAGSYPNPTLATGIVTAGTTGDSTHWPVVTVDAKGRTTAISAQAAPTALPPNGSAGGSLTGSYPNPTIATIPSGATATTQSAGDNSTAVATDAFVTTAVANAVAGVNPAVAVLAATTAAADTSSLTYANGASGVGATFTGSINTPITIDGVLLNTLGQRLLVKNDTQSPSGAFNGVYSVTVISTAGTAPVFTRALDYDTPSDMNNTGAIPVQSGTVNATTSWLLTSQITTVGTTPLTYAQFSLNPSTVLQLSGGTMSGAIAMGSNKITGLTNGSGAQDAAAFGQIPTSASTIGGMLTATYDPAAIAQQVVGTTASQTLTNKTLTAPAMTAPTVTGKGTADQWIPNNNAVAASSNAATVPVTFWLTTVTNNAAASITITITTTNAVDGQQLIVRYYDHSAAAQTLAWTNTENSLVSVPTTSLGSTTLPTTVGFIFNTQTTKWRCVAVS